MKRENWSGPIDIFEDLNVTDIIVLVPEDNDDRDILLQHLKEAHVSHRLAFTDKGNSARIDFPTPASWTDSGALELELTDASGTAPVYFWIVEIDEKPPRYFAWWSQTDSREDARDWNPLAQ